METNEDYFTLLGLDMDDQVSKAELKKAYRTAAREAHPDAGGSNERFQAVREAYETLSDPDLVDLYRAELALRMMRQRRKSGQVVAASDFVPYVLSNIDPDGRYSRPAARSADDSSHDATSVASRVTDEDVAEESRRAHADAVGAARAEKHGYDPDDVEAAYDQYAQHLTDQEADDVIKEQVNQRMDRLRRVGGKVHVLGVLAGLALGRLGVMVWSTGLLAGLFGIEAGDAVWAWVAHWQGTDFSSTLVAGMTGLGAAFGWWATTRLARLRRMYRMGPREVAALSGAAVLLAWTAPWWTTSWIALGVLGAALLATVVSWWSITAGRYLDTSQARRLGLRSRHSDGVVRTELSEAVRKQIVDELYDANLRRARQRA